MKSSVVTLSLLLLLFNQAFSLDMCQNVAVIWAEENLRIIQAVFPLLAPLNVARVLYIVDSCMWDSLAPFTPTWNSTMANGISRRPSTEFTDANRNMAVSYGAYRAIKHIFSSRPDLTNSTDALFTSMGYNVNDRQENPNTPNGIGNQACDTILRFRDHDGANFLADEPGTAVGGKNYSDYTNYVPVNDPQPKLDRTNCSTLRSINRWQPLQIPARTGGSVNQTYLTPYAQMITPFSLDYQLQFMPPGPPLFHALDQAAFVSNYTQVLNISSMLNDTLKVTAEYWADGPFSTLPPGHWQFFAVTLAISRNLDLMQTVNLLLLQGGASFDAGIQCWAVKRYWDNGRPASVIPCLYPGQNVKAWRGPYMGVGTILADNWIPYQDPFFVTPAFSEYTSGHSTFSAASAEVFKRFFGSDDFNYATMIMAGDSLFEPMITSGKGWIPGVTDVPNQGPNTVGYSPASNILLSWDTFSAAAADAGISRLYGGIHISVSNIDGATAGRLIGGKVWDKVQSLMN